MNLNSLIDAINELGHEKDMNREQVIGILESTILQAAEKKFPQFETVEAVYNKEENIIELFYYKVVVDEVYDENNEVSLEEAKENDPDAEIDDELQYEIKPDEYMPMIGQSARQILFQKIKEIEQEKIITKFNHLVNEIVHGTVGRVDRSEVAVMLTGKAEGILDRREQIPLEKHEPGEHIRALLLKIIEDGRTPKLLLSRTHPTFLRKLLEIEIPEIYDGTVEVVNISREPGRRAKISVRSNDPEIDAVGACIGQGGSRIHPVTSELHGEKIDVIEYSDDITVYISRALSPAQLNSITVNTEVKTADVEVDPAFLSKAIGKQGQNVRLASKLTSYKINVFSSAGQTEDNAEFDLDEAFAETVAAEDAAADPHPEKDSEEPVLGEPAVSEDVSADPEKPETSDDQDSPATSAGER